MDSTSVIDSVELSEHTKKRLTNTVHLLFDQKKGILAIDESNTSLGKKFSDIHIENTPEHRAIYRDLLCSTEGLENYVSGAILFEEAFEQVGMEHGPVTDKLTSKGILLGLKVDKGLMDFARQQSFTVGLDDLENRLRERKYKNVVFAKWRALFVISGTELPTEECIDKNCISMCKYAQICQKNGIVPVLEPEINLYGDYTAIKMAYTAKRIYSILFKWLNTYKIFIPGIILKISFISPGKLSSEYIENFARKETMIQDSDGNNIKYSDHITKLNISVLKESIPYGIGGIVYLSGGHNSEDSFSILSLISKGFEQDFCVNRPYALTYSFSRAFTNEPMNIWRGNTENISDAQKRFLMLLRKCKAVFIGEQKGKPNNN